MIQFKPSSTLKLPKDIQTSPYLDTAIDIANVLAQSSVSGEFSGATWLGDDLEGDCQEDLRLLTDMPIGADFYGGTAGVSWFLAFIGSTISSSEITHSAEQGIEFALEHAISTIHDDSLSLFSGATGVAIAAFEIGNKLENISITSAALELSNQILSTFSIKKITIENDFIGGISGIITGFISLYHLTHNKKFLEIVKTLSNKLVERSSVTYRGRTWNFTNEQPSLCGLAHGASGIALGLWEAGVVLNDGELLSLSRSALEYERSWFSTRVCAWPDLREATTKDPSKESQQWPGWMSAWCHGAIGIGITRLLMLEQESSDLSLLADVTAALQSTRGQVVKSGLQLKQGQCDDVTLCHGLGGIIEFLLLATDIFQAKEHYIAAHRVGDMCLRVYRQNNNKWTVGLPQGKNVPGLFLGRAGIGASMLRLHDPDLIPSPALPGYYSIRQARNKN